MGSTGRRAGGRANGWADGWAAGMVRQVVWAGRRTSRWMGGRQLGGQEGRVDGRFVTLIFIGSYTILNLTVALTAQQFEDVSLEEDERMQEEQVQRICRRNGYTVAYRLQHGSNHSKSFKS